MTDVVTDYATSVLNFGDQLGMVFLQLHDNFKPKDFERVEKFVKRLVKESSIGDRKSAVQNGLKKKILKKFSQLLEENNIANIIVDTAGRRDMLHMRLTS